MKAFLLDVNVLIALVDTAHVQHDAAHDWFARIGRKLWATCPLTENGLLRIVGHGSYPNSPGPPSSVLPLLQELRAMPGHVFWPDDISLSDDDGVDHGRLASAASVTDIYLLALARAHEGQLATLDRRLKADAVRGGADVLSVI